MYISVDMGGTNTRITGTTDVIHGQSFDKPIKRQNTGDYENDLQFIINTSKKIAKRGGATIKAVGIGTPGTPNPDRTKIASAINLPHWNQQPLVQPITNALNCPVYYDNDAVTAGLSEAYYGTWQPSDFHYLIWGTGIGGSEIKFDATGEVNYVAKLHWKNHFRDWTFECGGKALDEIYGRQTEKPWDDIFAKFSGHLLNYVATYQPPSIVFGGGLAERFDNQIEILKRQAGVDINISKFGGDSGIKGGFGLIRFAQSHNLPSVDLTDTED